MSNAISLSRFDNAAKTTGAVETLTCVGTTRAGSPTLAGAVNVLTTSAGQVAATLPADHPVGSPILVRVTSATAATVFPTSGGAINGGSADAAFSVAQNKVTMFMRVPGSADWLAVLSA